MPRTVPRGLVGKEKDWAEDVSIYVKLVCEALTDAKLLAAGPNGFWIWARGLLYAKQHLTDGVIPNDAMPLVAFGIPNPELEVSKLVTLRLWEPCEAGHRVPEKTWFKYHASAAHVNEISEVRREVGKKGGRPRLTDKTKLVSEKSNLQSEESKSAQDPKPRAQSTEHRVQSTEHKAHTKPADAECASEDQPSYDPDSPLDKPRQAYTASFERWYSHYPRKAAKQKAAAAFGRVLPKIASARGSTRDAALDWLCEVTDLFAASPKGTGIYVPHPGTWLNEGRYDDDPAEWNREGTRAAAPAATPRDSINGIFG